MIEIEITEERGSLTLYVKGHAGKAPKGEDIVCAAASMMAYTTAYAIKAEMGSGAFKCPPQIHMKPGLAVITCEPKEERFDEMLHIYYYAGIGYKLLANTYPDCVAANLFGEKC